MSKHEVLIYEATIVPHPNADQIELCQIGGYVSIVRKGEFKTGDLVAYIPEQSIVPEPLLESMGLTGKLSGSSKNRVKAVKLRGILSQGLIYRPPEGYLEHQLGQDVSEELGIKKWEPVIPAHLQGRAKGVAFDITVNYDVENIKKWDRHFTEGEDVAITEKIHGTNVQIGFCPEDLQNVSDKEGVQLLVSRPSGRDGDCGGAGENGESSETSLPSFRVSDASILYGGKFWVTSKGLGGAGVILDAEDKDNTYVKIAHSEKYRLFEKLELFWLKNKTWLEHRARIKNPPIAFIGEIFGPGIQKGFPYGDEVQFRIFDIALGPRANRVYLDWDELCLACLTLELPQVPILYVGPYSKDIVLQHTSGKETVSGKSLHMREGCVVKPLKERQSGNLGRVILKSISPDYLTRKGSEEDLTEFQ